MDDAYSVYKGDDPNIDLEFKIPAVLMDAICYSFACLSDEELCKKLLTASYYDSSFFWNLFIQNIPESIMRQKYLLIR